MATTTIVTDLADNIWTTRETTFDDEGFRISETLTLDDGRVRTTTWVDGVLNTIGWAAPVGTQTWTSRTTSYSSVNGDWVSVSVRTMADGQAIQTTKVNGVITSRTSTDSADAFDWSQVETIYDAVGRVKSSAVTYDDGRTSVTAFVDGIRTERTLTDVDDQFDWLTQVYDFDDTTGQLLTVTTAFDDGTTEIRTPGSGPSGRTISRTDTADAYDWDSRVTTFDLAGTIQSQTLIYDDGLQRVSTYSSGVLTQNVWTDVDDIQDWTTKTLTYDAEGRLAISDILLDNGRQIVQTYVDGVITQRTATDTTGAFVWTEMVSTYNGAGQVTTQVVTYDDGRVSTSTFDDGVLQDLIFTDLGDVYAWDTIGRVYDDTTGAHLYTRRTEDDGSQTFVDARGLDIVTGGNSATVMEDDAQDLQVGGTITLVDDYRGATEFTAIASVAGDNGLGVFTIGADGTWTYTADNAQAAIQGLNAGDTLTDSFTATTIDGVQTTVTTTIEGAVYDESPVYVGDPVLGLQGVGTLVGVPTTVNLNDLFSHDDGDTLSFSAVGLPSNVSLIGGILTLSDTVDLTLVGDTAITITATDEGANSTSQTVFLAVALQNDYGDSFSPPDGTVISGSSTDDDITFGEYANNFDVVSGIGDDTINFGTAAATSLSGGEINVVSGVGDDEITFGNFAGAVGGTITVHADDGNDHIIFGASTASEQGTLAVFGGNGADTITFGDSVGANGSGMVVDGGSGNNVITFGNNAANGSNASILVTTGDGDDIISFGRSAVQSQTDFTASITVNSGGGADDIRFGDSAHGGTITIDAGDGENTLTFGVGLAYSAQSVATIVTGNDSDIIVIGSNAGFYGQISLSTFDGDDTITFGSGAGRDGGSVMIDVGQGADVLTFGTTATNVIISFGDDADTDMVTFTGSVYGAVINDWNLGEDVITFTRQSGRIWTVADSGDDLVFTRADGVQNFTVTGAAGIAAADVAPDLYINEGPTFIGTAGVLPDGVVGSEGSAYSADLNALFTDPDIAFGDVLTLTTSAVPSGLSLVDGVLSATNSVGASGDYTITVTMTDIAGATAQDTLNFSLALDNDFGAYDNGSFESISFNGSSLADTLIFDSISVGEVGDLILNTGAGADVISAGSVYVDSNEAYFSIDTGTGADTITLGGNVSNTAIDLGEDSDTDALTFTGTLNGVTITDYVDGDDTITLTAAAGVIWSAADSSGNLVFTSNDGQSFTVTGAAGLLGSDVVTGITVNEAPIFSAASGDLGLGFVGTGGAALSVDMSTLFDDVDIAIGDALTYTATSLPAGFQLVNGVLGLVDPADLTIAGDYSVTVTATDLSGSSVSQVLTFELGINHNYGTNFGAPGGATVTGTVYGDTFTFGAFASGSATNGAVVVNTTQSDVGDTFNFGQYAGGYSGSLTLTAGGGNDIFNFGIGVAAFGTASINGGDGDNEMTFGRVSGYNGNLTVVTGDGTDTITFADSTGTNGGTITVNSGSGNDVITFGTWSGTSRGTINIDAGTGQDNITIGRDSQNLTIDLGLDSDADTLVFVGAVFAETVSNATVENFDVGVDIVDVVDPTVWTIADNGTDTVLTGAGSELTFLGVNGLTDISDFLI